MFTSCDCDNDNKSHRAISYEKFTACVSYNVQNYFTIALLPFVVISPIWKHYESYEMTLFHTMKPNGNVLFKTHVLFMTIYIYGSLNIR